MEDLEREGSRVIGRDLIEDPEAESLHDQLKIFAREVGVLYSAERVRTRELEHALERAVAEHAADAVADRVGRLTRVAGPGDAGGSARRRARGRSARAESLLSR